MKEFIFMGCSDDTFGEYGVTQDDYDNCSSGEPIQYKLSVGDSGLVITGCYASAYVSKGDGWMIGVSNLNEDKPVDWNISLDPCFKGYKGKLVVVAPDNAKLTCLNRD